jgi:hypothetical protein
VITNNIVNNAGRLLSRMPGLLEYENRVEKYAAEKISSGKTKILCGKELLALSHNLLFKKRMATGAARIDNL